MFYAHTISPIAVITSVVMTIFLGRIHPVFGVLALFFYVLVGAVIQVVSGRIGAAGGQEYREAFGALNTCVLDNLYGLEETLQYGQQEARIAKMAEQTGHLETVNGALKRGENLQRVITDGDSPCGCAYGARGRNACRKRQHPGKRGGDCGDRARKFFRTDGRTLGAVK